MENQSFITINIDELVELVINLPEAKDWLKKGENDQMLFDENRFKNAFKNYEKHPTN